MKTRNITHGLLLVFVCCSILTAFTSCDDFLDITPTGKVIPKTLEEYRALLTYEYKKFPTDRMKTTLRTEECTLDKEYEAVKQYYDSYLDLWLWKDDNYSQSTLTFSTWRTYYHNIYIANYILENRNDITNGSADEISQLVGEAYMMRAYSHFLLVNLYAEPYTHCVPSATRGVPIMLSADVNAIPRSSSVETVYQQVLSDLDEAGKYMRVDKWENGLNYRFNKASVDALRARTFLYMGQWQKAYDAAQKVISVWGELENISSKLPVDYKSVENIVALEHFDTDVANATLYVNDYLVNLYRNGDQRKSKYLKMINRQEYNSAKNGGYCSFRSSEAYLTAAEALAQLGKTNEAIEQLMPLLRTRLNSTALTTAENLMKAMSQAELIVEIADERTRELAYEGHRWFDLRRTTMPQLTRDFKGYTYVLTPEKYTFRFPTEAVEANPEIEIW